MTPNQWSPVPETKKYVVEVDKSVYKLLQRLQTIDYSAEIHLYIGESGKIEGLRVIKVKYECLTG